MFPIPSHPPLPMNRFQQAVAASEQWQTDNTQTRKTRGIRDEETFTFLPPGSNKQNSNLPDSQLVCECITKIATLTEKWEAQYRECVCNPAPATALEEMTREQIRTLHKLRILYMQEWYRVLTKMDSMRVAKSANEHRQPHPTILSSPNDDSQHRTDSSRHVFPQPDKI